jgi:hypothetical protein
VTTTATRQAHPPALVSGHYSRAVPYGLERDPIRCVQAHGNQGTVAEIASRPAGATGRPAGSIAQTLLNDGRAALGITDMLVHLRGTGMHWNPADHLYMAGQVLGRQPLSGLATAPRARAAFRPGRRR